jgi:NADH:ubiquinone oxidoreductase subunit D
MEPNRINSHLLWLLTSSTSEPVIEDIPPGWAEKCRKFAAQTPDRVRQYRALLDRNQIFVQRMRHVGTVPKERLLELGG